MYTLDGNEKWCNIVFLLKILEHNFTEKANSSVSFLFRQIEVKIPFNIFFQHYTKIFNITAGVDFLTTNSEIEMFCYLLLPWPRDCDFCFVGI